MAYKPELWAEAKKKCRLNEEEIRMAKEMGLVLIPIGMLCCPRRKSLSQRP